ncbi:protein-(glutamine-N5) methyltransferase, release factor-specific [Campylobacter rectus RM3267]|uniref:peptide chain release factor N(5)-glutamine methyltransferase n=2 Tax=Campylobacter rectus TaxID=203 RepID=A0A6G5QLP0_CAMRE|nr:peptide chain release factor N(5)-glutamine methyltransferase [Campylobacter rectus]EEF14137.1 protein-(glutamine-N5) methyltransferase, release factor-specific [Campylobacter rectus RM3267]QCD46618.1 protein-(glutamine-N5) methyltransferase [Campylobacter rectus]UEB47318.1 peptide chain release factor N(5)-glutamine methyltransferase [Campylobacter rectus]
MTVNDALKAASSQIAPACEISGANPARVAKALLMRQLGVKIEWIFLNLNRELEDSEGYFALAKRFANHEPLEYITGEVGFYGLSFNVKKGVLIPRPETEILVEKSLEVLSNLPARNEPPLVAEIGVGSGIISICLALNSSAKIIASDISDDALNLARENAAKFGVEDRIEFVKCAYLDQIYGRFDLLVSNPPYIAQDYELDKFVLNEPHEALFGGAAGDEILKNIIFVAKNRGVKYLACEMGYDQKASLESVLELSGFEAEFYRDLAGFDRGFVARNAFANL